MIGTTSSSSFLYFSPGIEKRIFRIIQMVASTPKNRWSRVRSIGEFILSRDAFILLTTFLVGIIRAVVRLFIHIYLSHKVMIEHQIVDKVIYT